MSRKMRGITGAVLVLISVSLSVGAAGCGSGPGEGDGPATEAKPVTTAQLLGKDFVSESVPVTGVAEGTRYRLSFFRGSSYLGSPKPGSGYMNAGAGCTSVRSQFRIRNDRLAAPLAMITGVGCGRAMERVGNGFQRLMLGHPEVRIDGEDLLLSGKERTIRLREMRQAEGDPPIEGTWVRGPGRITFDGKEFRSESACSGSSGTFAIDEEHIELAGNRGYFRHCSRATRRLEEQLSRHPLMGSFRYEFDDDGNLIVAGKNSELTFERSG